MAPPLLSSTQSQPLKKKRKKISAQTTTHTSDGCRDATDTALRQEEGAEAEGTPVGMRVGGGWGARDWVCGEKERGGRSVRERERGVGGAKQYNAPRSHKTSLDETSHDRSGETSGPLEDATHRSRTTRCPGGARTRGCRTGGGRSCPCSCWCWPPPGEPRQAARRGARAGRSGAPLLCASRLWYRVVLDAVAGGNWGLRLSARRLFCCGVL